MKVKLLLIIMLFFLQQKVWAQVEKLLYSTEFNNTSTNLESNWGALNSSSSTVNVTKTTDFSNESLKFTFNKVAVNPIGKETTRFKYLPEAPATGGVNVTEGWAIADKAANSYIELSALKSVTKVVFTHGATGSNRGYKLFKKNKTDLDWVEISGSVANPSSGSQVTVTVNDTDVALKLINLTTDQNAYLFDLKIYGNYTSTAVQHELITTVNDNNAGEIIRSPNDVKYDENSNVSLTAVPNFGYEFLKWVDAANSDEELSTANPLLVTINSAKNIKAVFKSLVTYNFTVNKIGSNWGMVKLSPEPVNGKYPEGSEVTMTIVPNSVTNFSFWEDNSTLKTRTVIVNSDKTYTATFDEIPFIVGWDFKDQNIKQNKIADFYSETINTGSISVHEQNGTKVNWLSNAGSFSPSYANIRLWTSGADFLTNRRYVQAQFSTKGYKNVNVKSMVSANYQAYSVMTLQYSLDNVTFTKVKDADITSVHNSSWTSLDAILPEEANDKDLIYLRWIADVNSTIINAGSDNDGAALTNVFIFADKEVINDTDAPLLISKVPAENSNTATINGSVVLTFNEKMKIGTGAITLGTKELSGVFGTKTVTFAYEKLNYNTAYTVTVPQGALTDMFGNAYEGLTFTFTTANRVEPTKKLYDAVVAQDGSGDFISVMAAIEAAPTDRAAPWTIFIKNGTYKGHHVIPNNKPFMYLIGQSRDGVIITDNRFSSDTYSPSYGMRDRATMWIGAKDCYIENITIENSAGYIQRGNVGQADALSSENDRFALNNVYLRSFQDTYQTSASSTSKTDRHYIVNSKIEGAVDFIYGGGNVFFDRDTLTLSRAGSVITAPSHSSDTEFGYVFKDCIVNNAFEVASNSFFGRPWQNSPKSIFLNTKILDRVTIHPEGWTNMSTAPAIFADYATIDKNGNLIDVSQRKSVYTFNGNSGVAKNFLTETEAAAYTYENVILREGDSWDPRLIAETPSKPKNVINNNGTITWESSPYTRLYVISRNGEVIGFSTTNLFVDETVNQARVILKYSVQAANEFGALSASGIEGEVLPLNIISFSAKLKTSPIKQVALNWQTTNEVNTSHFVIEKASNDAQFYKIGTKLSVNQSGVQNYSFIDENLLEGKFYYRLTAVDKDGKQTISKIVNVNVLNEYLSVFPNPTADYLNISSNLQGSRLKIYSSNGKIALNLDFIENLTKIDISNLTPGVYFIEINKSGEKTFSKFIKK